MIVSVCRHGARVAADGLLPRFLYMATVQPAIAQAVRDMTLSTTPASIIQGMRVMIVRAGRCGFVIVEYQRASMYCGRRA
ncbi:MAG: hypothetical protein WCL57_12260 [Chloroflexota bacterium]